MNDEQFMRLAIDEASLAQGKDEVPVGAIVVKDGKVLARAHNTRITNSDSCAHAEVEAIRAAGAELGAWNLSGCTLYVTLEPCAMCAGAISNARIARVVFGAKDLRFGALGSAFNFLSVAKTNHSFDVLGGILETECAQLLSTFFKSKRQA